MYKLVLVDDEEEVRKGIVNKIEWNRFGFEVVGEAENGSAALDLIEDNPPDVVITDIKMPIMDGLALSEALSEQYPLIKVVILSGFDDFKYAQQAIHYGIVEYALKPILPKEMAALLKKLKLQIDEETRQKESVHALKERYNSSLPILRDKFLTSLITGGILQGEAGEESTALGVNLKGRAYVVGCISVDSESVREANNFEHEKSLIKFAVLRIAEEVLGNRSSGEAFLHNDMVTVITKFESMTSAERNAFLVFDEIRQRVGKYLHFTVTIGMGGVCQGLEELKNSFKAASAALDYRMVMGANRVIPIDDCEPQGPGGIGFDDFKEKALTTSLKFGTEAEIMGMIEMLFQGLGESKTSLKHYQVYLLEILAAIVKTSKSMQLEIDDVLGVNENLFIELFSFRTVEDVKRWITDICIKLMQRISQNRQDSGNRLVDEAKNYIEQNYGDEDLTIQKLSSHLFISQSYLCTLFKKETGDTFLNYLIKVRIKAAKELLGTSKLKTAEIAERIGYSDPNYFSYFFKRNCGMSPREYRSCIHQRERLPEQEQ